MIGLKWKEPDAADLDINNCEEMRRLTQHTRIHLHACAGWRGGRWGGRGRGGDHWRARNCHMSWSARQGVVRPAICMPSSGIRQIVITFNGTWRCFSVVRQIVWLPHALILMPVTHTRPCTAYVIFAHSTGSSCWVMTASPTLSPSAPPKSSSW